MEDNKKYVLVTFHESGDEIHFIVIEYDIYIQVDKMINDVLDTHQKIEDMITLIHDNELENLMCQTYAVEDYSKISKYNIVKAIYLPELGN